MRSGNLNGDCSDATDLPELGARSRPKGELAAETAAFRRDVLKQDVYAIRPQEAMQRIRTLIAVYRPLSITSTRRIQRPRTNAALKPIMSSRRMS